MNTEEYPVTGEPSLDGGNFPRCQIGQLSQETGISAWSRYNQRVDHLSGGRHRVSRTTHSSVNSSGDKNLGSCRAQINTS